jgi:biotin carboxylase
MQLAAAAANVCDLLWMIDGSIPEMGQMVDLLHRFGPVADISGLDVDQLGQLLRPYQPDALVSYLDAGMVTFARVAEGLDLQYHHAATALALTDKWVQRGVLAAAGLPMPACHLIGPGPLGPEGWVMMADIGWPAVLKPRSAQGSRYTFLAHDEQHLLRLLDELGPERPDMVLEAYLGDDPARVDSPFANYVSVESLVAGGVISHLALTGRFPPAENFRETGFFIPAALDGAEQQAMLDLATRAIEALEVRVGCLHTEIKFTAHGLRIIEVNGRVGGGVPDMLERAAGIPLIELTLRVALGEEVRIEGPVATDRIGYRFFLQPPAVSATVASIAGLNTVSDFPGVDAISVHQGPGADLDWRDGSRNHIMAVVGSTDTYEELLTVDRLLRQQVTVTYADVRQ